MFIGAGAFITIKMVYIYTICVRPCYNQHSKIITSINYCYVFFNAKNHLEIHKFRNNTDHKSDL